LLLRNNKVLYQYLYTVFCEPSWMFHSFTPETIWGCSKWFLSVLNSEILKSGFGFRVLYCNFSQVLKSVYGERPSFMEFCVYQSCSNSRTYWLPVWYLMGWACHWSCSHHVPWLRWVLARYLTSHLDTEIPLVCH
jgi:hypothetical protein